MKMKMLEQKIVAGIPVIRGDIVEVPENVAREFIFKGWATTEKIEDEKAISAAKRRGLTESVADLSTRVETIEEKIKKFNMGMEGIAGHIDMLEEKVDAFDIDPELMTGPDAENREGDLDRKTAKRAGADPKKKGK